MNSCISKAFFILLASAACVARAPAATYPDASTVCAISQKVRVSVGPDLSLVEGRFWLQYVEVRDPDHTAPVWFRYPVFVPRDTADFVDLVELTQLKLSIGEYTFPPKSVEVADPASIQWVHPVPEDATVAWFTFELSREAAKTRFEVVITHAQPHYHHKGRAVSAWLPWMPDFVRFKMKLENFEARFEAMPGAALEPATPNEFTLKSGPALYLVRPVHRENVAVNVIAASST